MNTFSHGTEQLRAQIDLCALQTQYQAGEAVDVLGEFEKIAETPTKGTKLFIDTFGVAVGQSPDLSSFIWRTGIALEPNNIKKACNRIKIKSRDPSWIPGYAYGLSSQLGDFGANNPEKAEEAGRFWGEAILHLLEADLINKGVRNSIGQHALKGLNKILEDPRGPRVRAACVAKQVVLPR